MLGAVAVHDAGNATLVSSEGHVDRRREMSIEEGGVAVARRRGRRLQLRLRDKRCCCCAVCCTCAQPLQAGKCTLLYGEIGVGQRKGRFPKTMLLGPDWACAVVTVLLISSCTGIWLTFVAFPLHPAAGVVGILIAALVLAAFLVTSCSDPGIVPRQVDGLAAANEEGSADLPCNICQVLRPPGTIHCLACGVCIQDLDHHCPWTGKCIGKYTIRMFNTFFALLGLLIVYVVGIVFLSIAHFRNFGDL